MEKFHGKYSISRKIERPFCMRPYLTIQTMDIMLNLWIDLKFLHNVAFLNISIISTFINVFLPDFFTIIPLFPREPEINES